MSDSAEIFQRVRAAVDIVEIVGEHVALKRAGREFKGLCPFHDDHKPSMAVVPHKQIFHCFVCGMGGDVFKFVKEFHKMGNGEALRMLAQRAGIKLPELPPRGGGRGGQGRAEGPSIREQIAQTNEWACEFFQKQLRSPAGAAGLAYFRSRGLTEETIEKFRLGMSPDSWTGLVNAALRMGIPGEHLEQAGLVKKRSDGSLYDVFRGRVIFPILDATGGGGRVIAFGGRVLEEKRDEAGNVVEAKYLNSPETRLFVKSESMYGLNHARQHIVRTRTAVVVEGYMDVIACHQAGVTNVIATLGTALTPEHARGLKNYAQAIVLMFDSDEAGYRAADRAMEVFVRGTLDIKLSSVPDGKDPCDFCMKNGGEAFQKLVDQATDALSYKWERLKSQFDATRSISALQEASKEYLRFTAAAMEAGGGMQAMDPVRRGLILSNIARKLGMSHEEVQLEMRKLMSTGRPPDRPMRETAPIEGLQKAAPETGSAAASTRIVERVDVGRLSGLDSAEGWLLGAILAQPELYGKVRDEMGLHLLVRFRELGTVLVEYLENHHEPEECTLAEVTNALEEGELVRQAIELERRVSEWRDPSNLSAAHVKLVQQLSNDRGSTLEALVRGSMDELRKARGTMDAALSEDLGMGDEPEKCKDGGEDFSFFEEIKKRNAAGGNPRITG